MTSVPGPVLAEVIDALELTAHLLAGSHEEPLYLGEPNAGHFRYHAPTSQVMQILKAVRVVSGLRAAVHMASVAHFQEGAVVLRSVHDALQDIQVLDEAHFSQDGWKEYQQRLVNEFYQDDVLRLQRTLKGEDKGVPRVPRRKKLAAIERRLAPAAAGYPVRSALEGLSRSLMATPTVVMRRSWRCTVLRGKGGRFHMSGIRNPERLRSFLHWTAQFAHPALNAFTQLLRDTGHADEGDRLTALRKRLEVSDEDPQEERESSEGVAEKAPIPQTQSVAQALDARR